MNLEDGTTYVDGFGNEVRVILAYPESDFPFVGNNYHRYMADGAFVPREEVFDKLRIFDLTIPVS